MRQKLVTQREALGLSQQKVADKCGLARNSYSKIELGQRNPTFLSAVAIGKVLGVSIDPLGLFDNEGEEEK